MGPERHFTDADDARLLNMRDVLHYKWADIASSLGRTLGSSVNRYRRLTRAEQEPRSFNRRHAPKRIDCLRCERAFTSEGPHNRMCDRCRHGADSVSPYAPEGLRAAFTEPAAAA